MTMMKVVLLLLTATLTVMIRCSAAEGETTTVVPAGKSIVFNLSIMIIIINGGTFSFLSAHKDSFF